MTGNEVIHTSNALMSRLRIFEASQRPMYRHGDWNETSWGRCRVIGRMGQRHADILEAILFCAEHRHDGSSGGIKLLVDPARIRKTISDSRYSLGQIWRLIQEIMSCVVEIECPEFRLMGSPIESVEYAKNKVRRNPLTQGDRRMWTIRLGSVWSLMLSKGVLHAYDPSSIARLQHGISQAIARFLLSHNQKIQPNGGWKFATVMEAVGQPTSGQIVRNAKRRMRADAERLEALGIRMTEGGRFVIECQT